jgi:hypothetical protein
MAQNIISLSERGLISVSGGDALKFLQDLVTADMEGLAIGQAHYAGLLTPQGKILYDFFIAREEQGYLIDCVAEQRDELIKRLNFYKLRAKLDVRPDERQTAAALDEPVERAVRDPRSADMGWRFYGAGVSGMNPVDYHRRRILHGLAEGGHDFRSGELFPHEANFDQIGALSFSKGCFVGQEVVSRIEHRGTARSRILPCRIEGALPAKGAAVEAGSKIIGSVCSGLGDRALALLRLDRLEEARNGNVPLMAGASRLFPKKPGWARYSVPAFE